MGIFEGFLMVFVTLSLVSLFSDRARPVSEFLFTIAIWGFHSFLWYSCLFTPIRQSVPWYLWPSTAALVFFLWFEVAGRVAKKRAYQPLFPIFSAHLVVILPCAYWLLRSFEAARAAAPGVFP